MSNIAPVVLAQHVTKWYGPRRAVSDVSFAIEPGEIVGLLGPNGSGKSTIFRILTGYLAPSSGRVEVAGHDVVTDSLAVRQAISYVPEDAPLYDHMHVAEFLHYHGAHQGNARRRQEEGGGSGGRAARSFTRHELADRQAVTRLSPACVDRVRAPRRSEGAGVRRADQRA